MNRYCIKIFYILMYRIHISLFSCNNKNVSKEINNENPIESNYVQLFFQKNNNKVEMLHPIEYYKNEITKYQDNYYGFMNISMEITQYMNISSAEYH